MTQSEYTLPTAILLIILMGTILWLVFRGAKATKSFQDYAVGSIAFSPAAVGLALAASMTSAATFIINPGLIGLYGYSGVISYAVALPIAAFISLVFLTKKFREQGNKVKALTMAQWIGNRYQAPKYATFIAVLSLLLITFIVLIVVGLAQLLSQSLNVDVVWVMLGVVVFVFGYMMFGGANSMVYTNTIQAIMMLIVAVILLYSGHNYFEDGFAGFTAQLEAINPALVEPTNPDSLLFRNFYEIIFCQLIIGIAIVCQPHIITKSLLLKKDTDVNKYLTAAILTMVVFFSIVIVGLYARLQFPDMALDGNPIKPDQLIPTYVVEKFQVGIGLIVTMGLIAAGISTLEGLIQSLSITITSDLLMSNSAKLRNLPESKKVALNRVVIAAIAVVAVGLSYRQIIAPNLSVAIFAQNGVYAFFAAVFFPLIMGMFTKEMRADAAIVSSIVALTVHFGMYYGQIGYLMQSPINNPAISASTAIILSSISGVITLKLIRSKNESFNVKPVTNESV